MNIPLIIVGFLIMAVSVFINFKPKFFVNKFIKLDDIKIDPEYEFANDDDKDEFVMTTAIVKVKKFALLVLLVGVILVIIATN